MIHENNEERRDNHDYNNGNAQNIPSNSPPQNDVIYNAPVYNNQQYRPPVYNEPAYYPNPQYAKPQFVESQFMEQQYPEQQFIEPQFVEPQFVDMQYMEQQYPKPQFVEPHEIPQNMYSPGICVNQPYPRSRDNNEKSNTSQKDSSKGLVGFLRAMALVLVCAFFSGASAYIVTDYRFRNGDFAPPNQVILGGTVNDRRYDDGSSPSVTTLIDGMSAQDIYDMARNQVVGINTEAPGLFGIPDVAGATAPISGSGFIISSDGYILTNYHVVEIAHTNNLPITVVLNDGTTYEAHVVGFEQSNDVAVIKIDAQGLSASFIGNSDDIRVGQTIYAIGNPFGDLVYTMTDGIISALDRVVSVEGKSIRTFQFSAAVNRGNSGGPIYNTNGEVIGIVTAKVVRGNVEGIGFAIPINDAIEIASELIEHGYISGRPLLGITAQTVSPANAEYFSMEIGVLIRSVNQGSAADAAGLQVGDIITALDGEEIDSMEALRFALRDYNAGDTAIVTFWRDGETMEAPITFDEDVHAGRPEGRPQVDPDSPDPFEGRP